MMPQESRFEPWVRSVRRFRALLVALAALAAPIAALAAPVTFDIASQEMGPALRAFAAQAKVEVFYGDDVVAGVRSAGLKGAYEVEAGLKELLRGTHLSYERTGERTFVVVRQPGQGAEGPAGRFSEDVVVTATKRDLNVREVPSSVSALEGTTLESEGAAQMEDYILRVPGVSYNKAQPQSNSITMRGISTGQSYGLTQMPVGMYLNEIPVSDYYVFVSTLDVAPFDLERIEFLRGPQGTLYGASALGGAIRYITAKPDLTRFGGAVNLTASSVASGSAGFLPQAMVNVPLADGKLAIRGVIAYDDDGGYVDNLAIGKEDWNSFTQTSGRLLATWEPSQRFRLEASFVVQDATVDGSPLVDGRSDPDFEDPSQLTWRQSDSDLKQRISNLSLSWDLGFADLLSSTSYIDKDKRSVAELGAANAFDQVTSTEALLKFGLNLPIAFGDLSSVVTEAPTDASYYTKAWVQEFRLVSKDTGPLDWIAGIYYVDNDGGGQTISTMTGIEGAVNSIAPGLGSALFPDDASLIGTFSQGATEWAAYGELGIDLSPRWKLNLGARYYKHEADSILDVLAYGTALSEGPLPSDDSGLMPKVSLSYRPSDDLLWYALASRGYRVGGVNITAILLAPPGTPLPRTYETDKLWNYETGVKKAWAGGRVITDLSVFYLDWQDIQLDATFAYPESPSGLISAILNTGKAHSLGAEFGFSAQLSQGLTFSSNIAWTEAELDEDSLPIVNPEAGTLMVVPAGTRLPATPEWNTASTLQYYFDAPGAGYPFIALDHIYKDRIIDNFSTQKTVPEWQLWNLRVGATFARQFQVTLSVNNLLDQRQPMTRSPQTKGVFVTERIPEMWAITRPRSVSLTLQKKF